jgi:hypothetical protein
MDMPDIPPHELAALLWVAARGYARWVKARSDAKEKRISDFVSRFVTEIMKFHKVDRPGKDFELLVPCGVLLLNKNDELTEARRRIRDDYGLHDPVYPGYDDMDVLEYLRFCVRRGHDYNDWAGGVKARALFMRAKKERWFLKLSASVTLRLG